MQEVDLFFSSCELNRMVQEIIGNYIMMEEYFMREMIIKVMHKPVLLNTEYGQMEAKLVSCKGTQKSNVGP